MWESSEPAPKDLKYKGKTLRIEQILERIISYKKSDSN